MRLGFMATSLDWEFYPHGVTNASDPAHSHCWNFTPSALGILMEDRRSVALAQKLREGQTKRRPVNTFQDLLMVADPHVDYFP
jgi:hypothetical protein